MRCAVIARFKKTIGLICLVFLLCLSGCGKNTVVVPQLGDGDVNEYHAGKFVWFDLFTPETAASAEFYKQLFSWEIETISSSSPEVMTVKYDGVAIGNIVERETKDKKAKWLSYLSVSDVNEGLEIVTAHGGHVVKGITALPDRGVVAVVSDSQDATFALVKSSSGDPADTSYLANRWMGSELWTKDVDKALEFYTDLAGYEVRTIDLSDSIEYTMLISGDFRRAGVLQIPWKDVEPEWIPYIAVKDVSAVLGKVKDLGGRILLEPDLQLVEGMVAIISCPAGSVVGIQQLR